MSRGDEFRSLVVRSRQVVLASAVVGAITGVAVAGFDRLTIDVVFDRCVAHLPLWLMAFAPAAGLAVATLWLRYPGGGLSSSSADEYLRAFHARGELGVRDMLHRMVAAVATLGSGCAMGLEGPSIYLGATIGSAMQRRWRTFLVGADTNLLLVAGAAAGIAAIFKAPATGAIFAIEVPFQEDLACRMLLPALVAAATGYLALVAINGTTPLFPVHGAPPFSFIDLAGAAVLGLTAGIGAKVFASFVLHAKHVSLLGHRAARVCVCGATIAVLFAIGYGLTGQSLVLTPGYGVITWALAPDRGSRCCSRCCCCAAWRPARRWPAAASAGCSCRSWWPAPCSAGRSAPRSGAPIRCSW